jgi:hypothetical protein
MGEGASQSWNEINLRAILSCGDISTYHSWYSGHMNLGERNDGAIKLTEIKQEKERKKKTRQKEEGRRD